MAVSDVCFCNKGSQGKLTIVSDDNNKKNNSKNYCTEMPTKH